MLREPGFWVLAFMVICAAITLASSLYVRQARRRMLKLLNEMRAEGKFSEADKAWLRQDIKTAQGKVLLVAAPFAPFAIFAALALGLYEGWTSLTYDQTVRKIEADTDRLHAEVIRISEGIDPRTGKLWNDPRRREITDLSLTLETWGNPIAMTWIIIWMVVAAPFLFLGYLTSGTFRPFIANVWDPLRDPVSSIIRAAKSLWPTNSYS